MLKRKEALIHATKWMNLEDITLSEINQSRTRKPLNTVQSHLYEVPGVVSQMSRQKAKWWLPGMGRAEGGVVSCV